MLKFYNFSYIDSFRAVFMFILGARGLGKTWGAKYKAIKKALHSDEQFIYMRRYKTDLKTTRTFFADIEDKFPEWDFRVNGDLAQAAHASTRNDDKRSWKDIGYFIALSVSGTKKSQSFHHVTTIIYDEFIIEKGNIPYIQNEVKVFLEFYNTVDRYKDKTKVYFLANAVAIDNPYFIYWDIKPPENNKVFTMHDGFMALHFPDSAEFVEGVKKTRFGKFLLKTDPDYVDYAMNNKFADNHQMLIGKKPSHAEYLFTLETRKGTFSVWMDWIDEIHYFQKKRPKGNESLFTLIEKNMNEDKTLLIRSDKLSQRMRTAYRHGKCRFDAQQTRNSLLETFK